MKCPECVKAGKKSRVEVVGTTSTLAHAPLIYDEEGRPRWRDPNIHRTTYRCSEGHTWVETTKPGAAK